MAEFGIVFPLGNVGLTQAMATIKDGGSSDLPAFAVTILRSLVDQIERLKEETSRLDKHMREWHRANPDSRRLTTIPGIGVVTATALVGAIGDGKQFKSAREFSAWVGLVPNQNSSGGKERLGRISKKGNPYLRSLLVVGATTMLKGGTFIALRRPFVPYGEP
jgi:transposase